MTLGGWFTFILSAGSFTALFVWCLWKVLSVKPSKDDTMHGAFDISEIASEENLDKPKSIDRKGLK